MMSGFEEVAFKPLTGGGSIPFADDDASTIPSQSALYSSENLQGFPVEPEARLTVGHFRGPLLKSCTESSVPSTRSLSQSLGAARSALRKSRTDGCVPEVEGRRFAGSGAAGTWRRPEVGPGVENGVQQESSSGEDRSKSTNSIDAHSVNNILDQYEDLDYSPSSGLSDVGSIDVNNFEATMNLQRQKEAESRSKKPKSVPILPQTKIGTKIGKPIDLQTEQQRVTSEVEILLRKGEVQKRVDAWLSQSQSQSQSQGFKGGKERPLVRSNSSNCYRYGKAPSAEGIRARPKGGAETMSCDELSDEKARREKVSVGVNTSRGPYKEYLANRSRARQQEQAPKTPASRIPQRGNAAIPASKAPKNGAEAEREKEKEKARNGPLAVPTRRSSLKRVAAAGGEVGTVKATGPCAKGPSPIGESRPNKEGESCRPVIDATLAPTLRAPAERKEGRSRAPPVPKKANPVSSFKPNNAMYATLQAEEDQPFATSLGSESVVRSHYATPKIIEKIYERPMLVIHADDLEDVLRPNAATKVSAYGDRQIGKTRSTIGGVFAPPPEDDAFIEIEAGSRGELLETIMEDQRKENGDREPRFGTANNHLETIYASPRSSGIGQVGEPVRNTFTTFRQSSSLVNPQDKRDGDGQNGTQDLEAKPETPLTNGALRSEPEIGKEKIPPVVNAVLMKTLRFEQDLPAVITPKIEPSAKIEPIFNPPINGFNSRDVLSSDYDNVLLQDSLRAKEEKLYVTKEEMEHERLMEMLRKGDFEAAKSELERSYTLSTPGGGSPICCPPCSPPPAPTAYISSARASSRRLGVGGPSSPERDPLGRLLRFLKTFYRELGTRDPPHLPAWAAPLPLGTLCPAHFQPHLQLIHKSEQEHRLENIKIDQIFAPVRLSDGSVSEAPRRVAIEGGPGSGRTTLCLRLLHQWATQVDGGSPALALIVPLRELRGSSVLSYLSRELLPRTSGLGDAATQVWRTLHLMEDRVLFVLDGYDECVGGRPSLSDAVDLLEGRLFPDARILVTCSPKNSGALSPLVQRRVNLAGLEWPHVERLCAAYFIHNDIADRVRDFLEVLNAQPQSVRQLGQHPLGWVMLCSLYQDSGSLPEEGSALVQAAVKCIVKRSLDPPLSYTEEIPGHCRKRLEDFGRLALGALREGRCCYTEAELRARGGGLEVTRLGFLTRGLTFGQRRKPELFTPIHAAVAEFLAAYYLTSVAQYANILRRELEGLPTGIIGHLAGLLGPKTHLILNQLCPLEVPPRAVFSLLKSAGASDGNITAVCRLVGAGPGFGPAPNEPRVAPLVHTVPIELEGWARILESSACTLEALEVVFQVERGSDPRFLDDFFEALAANESVRLVRITSLLGHEFPVDEAQRLARHLKSVLGKNRLNDFELVITCLEESAHDRLECVVSALCRGLANASPQLARLVLDMNLSGEQVSRVCEALRSCVQVQALHLPHLGCGREGLASVAELLKERPLLALNLAGSWGAKNEDPSSSGISMGSGSGSGSSGCASSTLGTLPLNRCYSSLPRGAPTVYGSLTRPATLPRLPLGLGPVPMPNDKENGSKRNSDSVLCHRLPLLHPLPTCDLPSHQGTGFHEIFSAIREPNCKLRSLNVSKCLLGSLDAGCLAETIRLARNLDALRAAGASRPADMMPLVLALTEAPCLQLLDLASPRLALDDHPSRLLCHALARNSTLKLLSLEGWTFRIEESDSLTVFSELLRCTSVRELSLCNARLHLAVHEGPLSRLGRRDDAGAELLRAAEPPACPAIVFLRLAGFQVTVNDRLALRGPLLLPFLGGFTALSELDLSLDKSTIGGSSGSLLFIDDKILTSFFGCLSSNFRSLQSLRMNFWRVTLEDCDRTMRHISKYLKLCGLSFLKMNGLIVTDSVKKVQVEHSFLGTVVGSLQALTWLCIDGIELSEAQAAVLGKTLRDRFPGSSLEISAKDVNVKAVKALVAAVEDAGRAEVLYTGGAHCRLRISKVQKNGKHKKK